MGGGWVWGRGGGCIGELCGIFGFGERRRHIRQEAHHQLEPNFFGPPRLIRAFLPGFTEKNGGMIVNVSSVARVGGLPTCGLYTRSEFAVEGLH